MEIRELGEGCRHLTLGKVACYQSQTKECKRYILYPVSSDVQQWSGDKEKSTWKNALGYNILVLLRFL